MTKECNLPKKQKNDIKCANCQGEHTTNFSKCPEYVKYLEKSEQIKERKNPHKSSITFVNSEVSFSQMATKNNNNTTQKPTIKQKSHVNSINNVNSVNIQSQNNEMSEMAQIAQELREINEICNLSRMVQLLKSMKN